MVYDADGGGSVRAVHVHSWEIVLLGEEPVGISCSDCNTARSLDRETFDLDSSQIETWNADHGRRVSLRSDSGVHVIAAVESVQVSSAYNSRTEVHITLRQTY